MEESHVYNTSEITCNLHFQYLMCIAGLVFFFLGNCLNFISFGYAAQVSVDKHAYKFFPLLPFPLLMTTPIHSLHDWSNICHSASLSFLFLFSFYLSLLLLSCCAVTSCSLGIGSVCIQHCFCLLRAEQNGDC